jgi:hypothetical protein
MQGTCPISESLNTTSLDEGTSAYELIYSRYPSPEVLAALQARPRPVWDIRVLGWTTLTHGNRFDLGLP